MFTYKDHNLAIRQDGTLWAWGRNSDSQIGNGSSNNQKSPLQIGTDQWISIATGEAHSAGVKSDGTLWTWGSNTDGQLGLGFADSTWDLDFPTQVGTNQNWSSVYAGKYHTLAIKQDASAPQITTQPQSQTVGLGGSVSFSVIATGTAPLSYQWWKGASPLPGEITATYQIANAQPSHADTYFVVVSNPAGSVTSSNAVLSVSQLSQSITFGPLAGREVRDGAFGLTATASSGLPVSYSSSNPSVANVVGNTVIILGAGTTTITASQAGNGTYAAAPDQSQTLTINKTAQTISFGPLPGRQLGDAPFQLGATAGSGLPVSYSGSDSAVATVSGSTVTIVGVGTTVITASQAGNGTYLAATPASQSLTVSGTPRPGTVQFAQAAYSVAENGASVTLAVTRTGGTDGAVSVDYFTTAGTALAGLDFVAASGRLTWTAGDGAARTFAVFIIDDLVVEPDKTFTVTLVNAVGAGIGSPATATVTIHDNDLPAPPDCFVVRQLPAGYSGGAQFTVRLVATPPPGTSSYAVEDVPPAGWTVGAINQGGTFDAVNGKVKFGSFADANARTFSYELTPAADATGTQTFSGTAFANGGSCVISGPSTVNNILRHPADGGAPFGQITGDELTAYEAAWKTGQPWSVAPASIPISYVSRAGTIWRGGERYRFDPAIPAAPLWWVTNTTGTLVIQSVRGLHGTPVPRTLSDPPPPGEAWAELPRGFQRGKPVRVVIHVRPAAGVQSWALEETLPAGWQIVTNSISDSGGFDGAAGKVKWGTFAGARDLTYSINAGTNAAPALFSGVASFDGVDVPVAGHRISVRAPWVPEDSNVGRDVRRDGFHLLVQGEAGRQYVLEYSVDFRTWTPLMTHPDGATDLDFTDGQATNDVRRFYRVIER